MDNMIRIDKDYIEWLKHVKKRFKNTQIKASIKVNDELLRFYWSIGKDIVNMQAESKWGGAFFETLSEDLKKMFPGAKGFSTTNLRYMKRYYNLFGEILPQLGAELPEATNLPQVGAEIYAIPWGHIKLIVDKCKDEPEKAMFFVDEVIKNNWSRAVLLNFLDTNLYERQGKAISNFQTTLPAYTGDLAQEITKDPYNFDFIALNRDYNEKELKDSAIDAEKLYTSKCQNCHGATGEKSAYNSARPLKDLSLEDMQESIKDYKNGNKSSGNAIIMTPYANFIDYKELKGIHTYISKINNK
jgi:predicted nuclease of restriction endonuclease-like (RecB) superfamily